MIASRMHTVLAADRVLLLDEGMVAGLGEHDQLLHDNSLYAEIFYTELSAPQPVESETEQADL